MMWNFDMSLAPRGSYETKMTKGPKGQPVARRVFIPARIIACDKSGKTVTATRWVPGENGKPGRWNMFGSAEEPLAWMPWPAHPHAIEGDE